MQALAVIIQEPKRLALAALSLKPASAEDVTVEIAWSGISTGTEKLLWSGRMPHFPGMGYPLVPGYESVGRVTHAGRDSGRREGELVFVPGADCYTDARGLFGGAASRVVTAGKRVFPVAESLGPKAVLLALAATAFHAVNPQTNGLPELIVGHGVLGRLAARIVVALGGKPLVWEKNAARFSGAEGYEVLHPDADPRRTYGRICDVSGDCNILDALNMRLARGGEVVLAGFYDKRLSFDFAPAFMREATIRIAAEWKPGDLGAVSDLVERGLLSLDGLLTHSRPPALFADAYETAFTDAGCLKMILDWKAIA